MAYRNPRCPLQLCASAVGLLIAAAAVAEPQIELRVRLEPHAASSRVFVRAPRLGTNTLEATKNEADVFVAKLGLPSDASCLLPFDVSARSDDHEELLHLQLVRPRISGPIDTLLYPSVSVERPTRQTLIHWQDELQQAAADERSPNLDGLLLAYFRGRDAFRRWHESIPGHENTIRAARLWFDAAYQLARLENGPYRMDQAAVQAVQKLESEARSGRVQTEVVEQQFKPGYASAIIAEAEAVVFRYVSDVERLAQAGRYSDALALNSCLIEAFEGLPLETRSLVARTQSFTEDLLRRNDSFLRTKLSAQSPHGG